MKYIALPLIGVVLLLSLTANPVKAGTFINGYVYDSIGSTTIEDADVDGVYMPDSSYDFHTTTNSSGYYLIDDSTYPEPLPSGLWRVTASKPEYGSHTRYVTLPEREYINFYLEP